MSELRHTRREIVFDTETTGFDAKGDDRITEIGCVEVVDLLPTGNTFHAYLDPERDVPPAVVELTGLTREFLTGKPKFPEKAKEFLDFVGDAQLVAHNADFDRGFINAELERAGQSPIDKSRFTDTLKIARSKFPGSPASLDALCKRFNISLSGRAQHGALIDAQLLADVYLELNGGRARKLELDEPTHTNHGPKVDLKPKAQQRSKPLSSFLSEDEKKSHARFIAELGGDEQTMIWQRHWKKQSRRAF